MEGQLVWRYGATDYGLARVEQLGVRRVSGIDLKAWSRRFVTRANSVLWLSGPPPAGLRLHLPDGAAEPAPDPRRSIEPWSRPGSLERTPDRPRRDGHPGLAGGGIGGVASRADGRRSPHPQGGDLLPRRRISAPHPRHGASGRYHRPGRRPTVGRGAADVNHAGTPFLPIRFGRTLSNQRKWPAG